MTRTILFLLLIFGMNACGDDPVIENPEELITTLRMKFTAPDQSVSTLQFMDIDGEGGEDPVVTTEPLSAGTVYTVTLELLNESKTPAENITEEIEEEDLDHQFYFTASSANLFDSISYSDSDPDGNPIGLESTFTTSSNPGTGSLVVVLRHLPDKSISYAPGDPIPSTVGGETDIEVSFNITIQ